MIGDWYLIIIYRICCSLELENCFFSFFFHSVIPIGKVVFYQLLCICTASSFTITSILDDNFSSTRWDCLGLFGNNAFKSWSHLSGTEATETESVQVYKPWFYPFCFSKLWFWRQSCASNSSLAEPHDAFQSHILFEPVVSLRLYRWKHHGSVFRDLEATWFYVSSCCLQIHHGFS